MLKLIAIGAAILSFHTGAHHHRHYWWPAQDVCVLTTGTDRHGVWHAVPYIVCTPHAAHWGSTPAPPMAGIPVNSPQAQAFNQNYCPYKPDGWCTPPADPVNIGPNYTP
jgi:hypothetical protein